MARCPNCGQKTVGNECQCCHYPILRGGLVRRKKTDKREGKEAKEIHKTGEKVYVGKVELVIASKLPVDHKQIRQFEEQLKQFENIRIVWTGGSQREGPVIVVSLQKPVSLASLINQMPMVENVQERGGKIMVRPRTASAR